MKHIPLSVLELAIIREGGNAQQAIEETVRVARHTEQEGYSRLWLAEHHNMPYISSSATAVLIGHVAGKTKRIRVGSGGIMLPNHSPLVIAEQFGTLETLYPGRIDLGLGRAPGTDQTTAMALRRHNTTTAHSFPSDVKSLQAYFCNEDNDAKVRAFPGEGLSVPLWILGSSTDSAYLAAEMGLPYAFAAHFAPAQLFAAIDIYRQHFKPSKQLTKPYLMVAVNVIAADSDDEANHLTTSLINMFLGVVTGKPQPLRPPGKLSELYQYQDVQHAVNNMLAGTFMGGPEKLRHELAGFISDTQTDELMVTGYIYDPEARLKSFSILKRALDSAGKSN